MDRQAIKDHLAPLKIGMADLGLSLENDQK